MPAARPSQATVRNTLNAIRVAGYRLTSVCVGPDGSFKVDVASASDDPVTKRASRADDPLSWDEA